MVAPVNVPLLTFESTLLSTDQYQKLLSQIARNIRRTLDLDTICSKRSRGWEKD
jgi:hypothetical protein